MDGHALTDGEAAERHRSPPSQPAIAARHRSREMEGGSGEEERIYLGVAARLHGVLAEELVPIRGSLSTTERSVMELAERLQRVEDMLLKMAEIRVNGGNIF